jgi:hypothetical protein
MVPYELLGILMLIKTVTFTVEEKDCTFLDTVGLLCTQWNPTVGKDMESLVSITAWQPCFFLSFSL